MKIVFISTYPPQQCGIATFTQNLLQSVSNIPENIVTEIVLLDDGSSGHNYPDEVKFRINKDMREDYLKAAEFINRSGAGICILQHEFGIFGGKAGVFILPLVHALEIPLMVTLHTILKRPDFMERSVLQSLAMKADKLVAMTSMGVGFLEEIYNISAEKVVKIEHGVPDFKTTSSSGITEKIDFDKSKVLFTFGLLGRNKGIETVLQALPRVISKHPDVLYMVLGKTHPNVIKATGERYRSYLNLLVKQNDLEQHVFFLNKFVSEKDLFDYLSSIDIYITPYLSEAQITSGTLSYALGAGAAVVSTPYWHASELLSAGLGRLFKFKDSEGLAEQLIDLLDHPQKLKQLKDKACAYGRQFRWKAIGKRYFEQSKSLVEYHENKDRKSDAHSGVSGLPPLNFDHFKRLTDDTGIIQHAKYGIPNLKEGYCLDDNARALLAALMAYEILDFKPALALIPVYFSYIHYMQNIKGTFRNFLSFNRQFLDEEGSEDAFGRTIWALGYLMKHAPNNAYFQLAEETFFLAAENFEKLTSNRGIANTIIGISYYLQRSPSDEEMCQKMERMTHTLVDRFQLHKSDEWQWFEDMLSYDNGILPLALYHSYEITGDKQVKQVAEEATAFLDQITMADGYLNPVGSDGWFPKGKNRARFDQQATDVTAMVLLNFRAWLNTKQNHYRQKMLICHEWFLGKNDLKVPLYDPETGGCCDGLESDRVNRNQGAESTLAYLISYMTVLSVVQPGAGKEISPELSEKRQKGKARIITR